MERVFLEGLLLQASLIFALGAQNLFVLESGLRRQHQLTVSFVCFLCDLTLIMCGVAGAGTLFAHFPQIKILIGVIGIFFLLHYGLGKLRVKEEQFVLNQNSLSLKSSILKAITFSVVNPHAYLDGIVLIGGYSAKYSLLEQRLALGFGASAFSLIWFLVLSTASAQMMPLFQNPKRMRFIMSTAGLLLIFLSAKLSVDVYGWVVSDANAVAVLPAEVLVH